MDFQAAQQGFGHRRLAADLQHFQLQFRAQRMAEMQAALNPFPAVPAGMKIRFYAEFSQQNGGYLNRDANYIPVNWNDILDSSGLTESFVTEVLANTAMWDAFTAQFQTTLAQHEVLFQQKTKDSK